MNAGNPGRLSHMFIAAAVFVTLAAIAGVARADGSFSFTVTADPRNFHTEFNDVLTNMNANTGPTAFLITVGDLDDITEGTAAPNRAVIDSVFGPNYIWYPIVGNHDTDPNYPTQIQWLRAEYTTGHNGRAPLKNSTLQNGPKGTVETTYSFDYGDAHFIAINEYWNGNTTAGSDVATDGDVVPKLLTWITNDINATKKKVIFVIGHEPAYPWNGHGGDSLDEHVTNRNNFWNLLESKGVAAYFCGHTHVYSKYQKTPGKTWQIDCGNCANDSYGTGFTFMNVKVSPQSITFNQWHGGGDAGYYLASSWSVPLAYAAVTARVFYNNSAFDGNDPSANAADDTAIATDKVPLLPANTATLANYTSYSKGINGIMIDIPSMPGTPKASDFALAKGNSNTPDSWISVPLRDDSISVRKGAGVNGSDRVTIVLPDGSVTNTWLQITVKTSTNTGVAADLFFYFGNAVGETGNSTAAARVDLADLTAAHADPHRNFANPAPITDMCDFNRDKVVNTSDEILIRNSMTTVVTQLNLISVP